VAGKSCTSLAFASPLPFVLRARSFDRTRFERACVKRSGKGLLVKKVETFHVTGGIPGGAESWDLQAGR
jgi:hypothetical protein